jgi:hypothetical protein
MKTLAKIPDLTSIRVRFAGLTANDKAAWGSMTVGQMVCHCTDSFLYPLGERSAETAPAPPIPRSWMKWLALQSPMQWPRGVRSIPEMIQGVGGTPPKDFATDRRALLLTLDRFAEKNGNWPRHPIFGEMTEADWMRWGYLHADHHLRQFGR